MCTTCYVFQSCRASAGDETRIEDGHNYASVVGLRFIDISFNKYKSMSTFSMKRTWALPRYWGRHREHFECCCTKRKRPSGRKWLEHGTGEWRLSLCCGRRGTNRSASLIGSFPLQPPDKMSFKKSIWLSSERLNYLSEFAQSAVNWRIARVVQLRIVRPERWNVERSPFWQWNIVVTRVWCRSESRSSSGHLDRTSCGGLPENCRWNGPLLRRSNFQFFREQKHPRYLKSPRVSVQVCWSWNRCSTLSCSDELEDFRIGSDHTVNHVDLLRRLDNSIFVLSVAADIGRPKLLELDLSVELIWNKSSKLYLSTDFALS